MSKVQLNISQVIGLILKIESDLKIKCLSYGLYDKANKEYITEQNKHESFDYYDAYDNRCRLRYTHDESLKDNTIAYLFKHHGQIYFPMLKRGTQKAYIAQFDIDELLTKYGCNHDITPSTYFKDKFCFSKKSKKSKQCEGQLSLPLESMM